MRNSIKSDGRAVLLCEIPVGRGENAAVLAPVFERIPARRVIATYRDRIARHRGAA